MVESKGENLNPPILGALCSYAHINVIKNILDQSVLTLPAGKKMQAIREIQSRQDYRPVCCCTQLVAKPIMVRNQKTYKGG